MKLGRKSVFVNLIVAIMFLFSNLPASAMSIYQASSPVILLNGVEFKEDKLLFAWKAEGGRKLDSQKIANSPIVKELLSYYYSALAIPEKNWWVDLFIFNTEDDVMGTGLEHTMLGYVMLDADLRMKRLINQLMSPDSPTGQLLWERLARLGVNSFMPRFWMVPGKMRIYTNEKGAYLDSARIKVKAEIEDKALSPGLKEKIKQILEETIIPELEKAINTSSEFAKLRQAYYALVLASWTKEAVKRPNTPNKLGSIVDSYITPDVGAIRVNRAEFLQVFARYYLFSELSSDFMSLFGGGFKGTGTSEARKKYQQPLQSIEKKSSETNGSVTEGEIPPTKDEFRADGGIKLEDQGKSLGVEGANRKFYGVGKIVLGEGVTPKEIGYNINVLNLTKEELVVTKEDLEIARLPKRLGYGKTSNLLIIQYYDENGEVKKFVFSPLKEISEDAKKQGKGIEEILPQIIGKMDVLTWMQVTDVSHIQRQYEKFIEEKGGLDAAKNFVKYHVRNLPEDLKERILANLEKVSRGEKLTPEDVLMLVVGVRAEDDIAKHSKKLLEDILNMPIFYVNQGGFGSISSTLARENQMIADLLLPLNSIVVKGLFKPARWTGRGDLDEVMRTEAQKFLDELTQMQKEGKSIEEAASAFMKKVTELVKEDKPVGDFIQALDLGYKQAEEWLFKGMVSIIAVDTTAPPEELSQLPEEIRKHISMSEDEWRRLTNEQRTTILQNIKTWYHNARNEMLKRMKKYYIALMEEEGFENPYDENGVFSTDKALANLDRLFKPIDEYLKETNIEQIIARVETLINNGQLPEAIKVKGHVYYQDEIINQINTLKEIYEGLKNHKDVDLPDVVAKRFWEKGITSLVSEDTSFVPLLDFYKYTLVLYLKNRLYPIIRSAIGKAPSTEKSSVIIPIHGPGKADPGHWGHLLVYADAINHLLRAEMLITNDNGEPRKPKLTTVFLRIYFAATLQFLFGKKAMQLDMTPSLNAKYHNSIGEEIFPEVIRNWINSNTNLYALLEGYQFGIDHLKFSKAKYIEEIGNKLESIGFKETVKKAGQAIYYNPQLDVWFVVDDNLGTVVQYTRGEYNKLKKLGYTDEELHFQPKGPEESLKEESKANIPSRDEELTSSVEGALGISPNNKKDVSPWLDFVVGKSEKMPPEVRNLLNDMKEKGKLPVETHKSTKASQTPGGLLLSIIKIRFVK